VYLWGFQDCLHSYYTPVPFRIGVESDNSRVSQAMLGEIGVSNGMGFNGVAGNRILVGTGRLLS
jgi:hypothetical protein